MSDTTPSARFESDEDAQGHAARFVSDPGEIGVETGQGKRPFPGEGSDDDTVGHRRGEEVFTGDGTADDTEGHRAKDWVTGDGTEDDTEGHRVIGSAATNDGIEGVFSE